MSESRLENREPILAYGCQFLQIFLLLSIRKTEGDLRRPGCSSNGGCISPPLRIG